MAVGIFWSRCLEEIDSVINLIMRDSDILSEEFGFELGLLWKDYNLHFSFCASSRLDLFFRFICFAMFSPLLGLCLH